MARNFFSYRDLLRLLGPPWLSKVSALSTGHGTVREKVPPGELMRFVEFWHGLTGYDPQWLYFDSKAVPYPELSRINRRGIHFVAIRRRGAAVIRRLRALERLTLPLGT